MALELTVYSDFACPFCYVGQARTDRLCRESGLALDWKPYEIHPETPEGGRPLTRIVAQDERRGVIAERVQELAAEDGLTYRWPAFVPNSHRALLATEYARDQGQLIPFHTVVLDAHWVSGQNIGDPAVLLELAERCGLERAGVAAAWRDPLYEQRLDVVRRECQERQIVGVPTFVIGPFTIVGAQPYAILQRAAEKALALS